MVKIAVIQSPRITVGTLIKILAKIQNNRVAKQQRHNQVVRFKQQNDKLAKKQEGWAILNNAPCFDLLLSFSFEGGEAYNQALDKSVKATPPVFMPFVYRFT